MSGTLDCASARSSAAARACTAAVRVALLVALAEPLAGAAADFDTDVTRQLLQRTNALRATSGWKPLAPSPRLTAAARRYALYMAQTDRYGHEVDGQQPAERAKAQGYDHCLTAENIAFATSARGFTAGELAQRLFDGWVQSPPHRRNLVDGDMTEVGMAVAQSARSGRHYAVQLFGRPRALALRVTLANRSRDSVHYELGDESYELKPNAVRTHQRCRRALLALKAEGLEEAAAKPIAISAGARYRIDDTDHGIRLRRE